MLVSDFLMDLFSILLRFSDFVWDIFFTPVSHLIEQLIGINIPDWDWLNYSLFMLMLDAGLMFFIAYTIIKWILNIIT